jgi:hypothetical protein
VQIKAVHVHPHPTDAHTSLLMGVVAHNVGGRNGSGSGGGSSGSDGGSSSSGGGAGGSEGGTVVLAVLSDHQTPLVIKAVPILQGPVGTK